MKYIFTTAFFTILALLDGFCQPERNIFLEHFSNTNCESCAAVNASFYEVLNQNPNLIHISYHLGLPKQNGFFYEQNIEDNSAVQNFYAINNVPALYINGDAVNDSTNLVSQNTLNLIYGQNLSSPFVFNSFDVVEQVNGDFKVAIIIRTELLPEEGNYVLRMAVVESSIDKVTNNGESVHINVMRKMLDGFEGRMFDPPATGNRVLLNYNFNVENEWKKENIFIISWIQDTDNKEIVTAQSSKNFAPPLQSSITELINVSCFEEVDGGINISVENGVPPYSFLWSDGSTAQNLSNVAAGIYSVEITDNAGTKITKQASISEPTSFIVDLNIFPESNSNANGRAEISISGASPLVSNGMPYYKIDWSNGVKDSLFIDDLSEGTYNFVITDANNCNYNQDFFIPNNIGDLRCDFIFTNPKCFGENSGNIVLSCRNFVPPVLYKWGDGAINRERFNIKAGSYSVVVTDQINAVYNLLIELEEPPQLKNNLEIIDQSGNQNNGAAYANPSGGFAPYKIEWLPGGETTLFIDSLSYENSSGNPIQYVCNLTDYNGCKLSTPFSLQPNNTQLNITVLNKKNVLCFGEENGSIEIGISGGNMGYAYDIDWFMQQGGSFQEIPTSPSNTTILNNLKGGTYLVAVTDEDYLTLTDTIKVEEPEPFEIAIEYCDVQVNTEGNVIQNGLASVTATGGTPPYLYQWSNGSANNNTNINISSNLTITVFDINNCKQQQTIFINESTAACVLSDADIKLYEQDILIQPNLVKSSFSIYSNYPVNKIEILNLDGQTVFQKKYIHQFEFAENLKDVPNGIYLIAISTNKGILTKKIMKY